MSSRPKRKQARRAEQAASMLRALARPEPPRVAILVSGGKLSDGAAEKIRRSIEAAQRSGNFHKVLVLPSSSTPLPDGRFRVTVEPLA